MVVIYKSDGTISLDKNTNQITGEKIPGELDGWRYYGTDPNELIKLSYGQLSSRGASLFHSSPPVIAAIKKFNSYTIGPGLHFRSQPDHKMLGITQKEASEWANEFQRIVHYYFLLLNFYQKQSLIFKTSQIMGDSLLMFDRAEPESGLPFDLIETGGDQIDYKYKADDYTLGIKHDSMLRRKGVALTNGKKVDFRDENGDQNLIQFFDKEMARQLRGMPLDYRIIALVKNNERLMDSMLHRAVMESLMIGYKQGGNVSDLQEQLGDLEVVTGRTTGEESSDISVKNISDTKNLQGGLLSLESGESLQFTDLKTPSNNFDKLQKAFYEMCGMGMGIPPCVMLSEYTNSFTSHKGSINDFIKSYTQKRRDFVQICANVVLMEVAKDIFLSGKLDAPNSAFFNDPVVALATLAGNWLGPVPGHINPMVEVKANLVKVEGGLMTRGQAAAEEGNEFDDMIEQWGEQERKWKEKTPEEKAETIMNDQN